MLKTSTLAMALLALSVTQTNAGCADLALVLAIDASGSIDPAEFAVQQGGYATAFLAPRVRSALHAAGIVDIAVVLWADGGNAPQILPWQRLRSADDATLLSQRIAVMSRTISGNTRIGIGVSAALDLLEDPQRCALRQVINVSGDGIEAMEPRPRNNVPLSFARARAAEKGVTINALAIENEVPDLANWYREKLVTGPDAFVMEVEGFETFADAIEAKLAREIGPPDVALLTPEPLTNASTRGIQPVMGN